MVAVVDDGATPTMVGSVDGILCGVGHWMEEEYGESDRDIADVSLLMCVP
jgi:hypothetical protein